MKIQDSTCVVKFLHGSITRLQLVLSRCEITPAASLRYWGHEVLQSPLDYHANSSTLLKIQAQSNSIPNELRTFLIDPLFSPVLAWKQEPASLGTAEVLQTQSTALKWWIMAIKQPRCGKIWPPHHTSFLLFGKEALLFAEIPRILSESTPTQQPLFSMGAEEHLHLSHP